MEYQLVPLNVFIFLLAVIGNENNAKGDTSNGNPSVNLEYLRDLDDDNVYMPHVVRCDGCRIMDKIFYDALEKLVNKSLYEKPQLLEIALIELFESLCNSQFIEYGYAVIDGKKRMKGPGLGNEDLPGVMHSNGKWSIRLQNMCKQYSEELGEREIYEAFLDAYQSGNRKKFFRFLCEDSGSLAFCAENTKTEL
ncbi:unnamed protein product [Soboliphyme baturini]|uniref:DUF3456 domain-containing protein n=1 Tax=Soboliphyme baturini TaxID=241478 RepID=A0A183IWD6_9BILA|nr:unnamed protein product [Soboliphyme baturini]